MKTSTLKNRLEKRFTGSKTRMCYKIIVDIIENTNKSYMIQWSENPIVIRPVYTLGSGRRSTNQDHTLAVTQLLDLLGVKYETGNDAPRGGLTGNYIKILTKIEY